MTTVPVERSRPARPPSGLAATAPPGYAARFDDLFALSYRVARRILDDDGEAEDLAGTTLAKAWVSWGRVEGYAEAWVVRVTTNGALSVVRRRRLRERLPMVSSGPTPPPDEWRDDLVDALRRLPRRQREVVALRFLADKTTPEVAELLGCTVGTVKQHSRRGLAALRTDVRLTEQEW